MLPLNQRGIHALSEEPQNGKVNSRQRPTRRYLIGRTSKQKDQFREQYSLVTRRASRQTSPPFPPPFPPTAQPVRRDGSWDGMEATGLGSVIGEGKLIVFTVAQRRDGNTESRRLVDRPLDHGSHNSVAMAWRIILNHSTTVRTDTSVVENGR